MKIGFLESIVIIIGLMWILGVFRKMYNSSPQKKESSSSNNIPSPDPEPAKKPLYGEDGEYVEYEEIP